jgi:hypothetical protein
MVDLELQSFRLGFCTKAAELGYTPSELLAALPQKQADVIAALKTIGKGVGWSGATAGLTLLAGGALAGGLAAKGMSQVEGALDPTGDILGDEDDPLGEVKKIQLIAKYRNAKDQVKRTVD